MANVGRTVIGLCLAAQDSLHDLRTDFFVDDFFKYGVERLRLDHLTKREFDFKSLQIFLERNKLFPAWRLMRAIDQG